MSEPLWLLDAMAVAMNAKRAGDLPRAVPGLSIDTRTIKPGEAFFAIQGENRDGHDFVEAALKAGAGLAVVARDKQAAMPKGAPLLVVPDVLEALNNLARASRARSQAKIVAVTGSVGKTSTKEALRRVLGAQGETHASAASFNNHWGVPLSLALMPQTAKFGVFEIGMNHAGEITPLTQLVRPHVAIVTTIAPVHLEFFGTLEAIADAKAEIFSGVEPGGAAVLNADNAQFGRLKRAAQAAGIKRVVSFGESASADARALKVSLQAETSTVQARILGHDVTYKLGAPGRHVVDNSLAVLAAATLLGADLALAALALGRAQGARRARRADHARRAGRRGAADRRELQRQPDLDARRARAARPGADAGARAAHRGARRHAGAWAGGRRAACSARRSRARQRDRSRLLRRAADEIAVGRASLRAPRRLCRDVRGARSRRCSARSRPAMP